MTDLPTQQPEKRKRDYRGLLVFLLLPLLCAVVALASQLAADSRVEGIDRDVQAIETADYSPWDRIVFAPVDEAIITQVVLEIAATIGDMSILGTATQAAVETSVQRTVIAQMPTATATITPSETATASDTPTATETNTPTETQTATSTATPTATNTPTATQTPQPSATIKPETTSIAPIRPTSESANATASAMVTPTATASTTPTATNTPTATVTATRTPTRTPSPTITRTPTVTRTPAPEMPAILPTLPPPVTPTNTPNPLVAIFSASSMNGTAPLTVQFTNLSVGNISSYQWNFGDGTSSNQASPSHTFSAPGSYYVRFDVFGATGTSAAGVTIVVTSAQPTNPPVPTNPPANTPVPTNPPLPTNPPAPTNTLPPGVTPSNTPLPTATTIPTDTPIPADTATNIPLPTATNTPIPADTATNTPIPTHTPISTETPTDTPIPPALFVTGLTLYNADTDTPIMAMFNGMTISYAAIGTNNINILANTNPAVVGSVDFSLPGVNGVGIANTAPYFADNNTMSPAPGTYTITAIAYENSGGGGAASAPVSITFTIAD